MGAKYGFLIPDTYELEVPGEVDMNIASIFWGFSLGVAVFSAGKGAQQSYKSWRRYHRVTAYVGMIWGVWISSMILGILAWGFQRQYIRPSFAFYFNVALWWAVQVQLLLQIILNRLGLLMVVPGRATKLKLLVFLIILAVNISVFIIWMPARLQINQTWIHLNDIWDRCEKVIFATVDGVLNAYFIYLVRSQLINNGLTKYVPLYRMNLFLIFVSMSLDVVLVGLMSLKSSLVYLSFHPVCYLLKLQIEMKMAELITKIVRSTSGRGSEDIYYRQSFRQKSQSNPTPPKSRYSQHISKAQNAVFRSGTRTQIEAVDRDSDLELEVRDGLSPSDLETGIIKTVHTTVASAPADKRSDLETGSRSSSTRELHYVVGSYER